MDLHGAVFGLREFAPAPPHAPEHLLASDDRVFDAEVLRSVLHLLNMGWYGPPSSSLVREAFGWIPPIMAKRAAAAGIPLKSVAWNSQESTDAQAAAGTAALLILGPMPMTHVESISIGKKVFTPAEYIDSVLAGLAIYARRRFIDGSASETQVPLLNCVQACVAYAVSSVYLDRHKLDLHRRIKQCNYLSPKVTALLAPEVSAPDPRSGVLQQRHLFLDARFDDSGKLRTNEASYCCPQHANREKQRRFRNPGDSQRTKK